MVLEVTPRKWLPKCPVAGLEDRSECHLVMLARVKVESSPRGFTLDPSVPGDSPAAVTGRGPVPSRHGPIYVSQRLPWRGCLGLCTQSSLTGSGVFSVGSGISRSSSMWWDLSSKSGQF